MARKKQFQWEADAPEDVRTSVSRSQKKRDSTALQELGKSLTELPLQKLDVLPLTDDLREALTLMARLTDREGHRRQLQYIGRLMREADSATIAAAYARLQQGHQQDTATLHHAERLRTALLEGDAAERTRLLAQWPEHAEELQSLIDSAHKESAPHAARALFRRLRALLEQEAG